MSTTWVIYREVRNTGEKSPTRPHSLGVEPRKALARERHTRSLRPIMLAGGVTVHQGDDR